MVLNSQFRSRRSSARRGLTPLVGLLATAAVAVAALGGVMVGNRLAHASAPAVRRAPVVRIHTSASVGGVREFTAGSWSGGSVDYGPTPDAGSWSGGNVVIAATGDAD